MLIPQPLILFIDAYDSFSNNIISLLESTLSCSVRTIKIDNPKLLASDEALHEELSHYVAVVCGPGPGHPAKEEDVGIIKRIWKLGEGQTLPVLGICLGFQSLCLEFGASVTRLKGPQHGMIRKVTHIGEAGEHGKETIFGGVGEIRATLYQSLCVDIGQDSIPRPLWDMKKWEPSSQFPEIVPLAWVEADLSEDNDSEVKDARVLAAVQHKTKPFWALQYHPESICTNEESKKVIKNWFKHAQWWNRKHRQVKINHNGPKEGKFATRESLLRQWENRSHPAHNRIGPIYAAEGEEEVICHTRIIKCSSEHLAVPDVVEAIQDMGKNHIILESTNAHDGSVIVSDVKGRYSIIALDVDDCRRFEYTVGTDTMKVFHPVARVDDELSNVHTVSYELGKLGGVWPFLAQYLDKRQVAQGNDDSPFWGGFMGYTTYELGLEGIDVQPRRSKTHSRPDLCFAWVTRSLIVDHLKDCIYLQELAPKTSQPSVDAWMDDINSKLERIILPVRSFDPFVVTFRNIPTNINQEQFLERLKELTSGREIYNFDYHFKTKNYIFTGIATGEYNIQGWPIDIENLRKMEFSGQKVDVCIMNQKTAEMEQYGHSLSESERVALQTNPFKKDVLSINTPAYTNYESKVLHCQEYICAGDSYELCLTDQTAVTLQKPSAPTSSWDLYRTLRTRQPAPFASYIHLGPLTLVSSSPERFLTWTSDGHCSLRPMKGTVKKSDQIYSLEQAKKLLDVPKEKAENLMIVDLVRHDLHWICGSGNVQVPRLMVVEEYKSVFQMISVVEGQIPQLPQSVINTPQDSEEEENAEGSVQVSEDEGAEREKRRYTGLDVLAASLPPGSMTGAPKKRSCEILGEIEGKERGLYSGVIGYLDVRGRGDWSVTIRSMFQWDDEDGIIDGTSGVYEGVGGRSVVNENDVPTKIETWHIGAGGAVTALSTEVGEREEMQTKLSGTLGIFRQLTCLI